jgi:hypothetical protein
MTAAAKFLPLAVRDASTTEPAAALGGAVA